MIFGAGVTGFPPGCPCGCGFYSRCVARELCLSGSSWFGGKENLAIRKTIGVFKAKAAVPSHFRLCTSALLRENLHRGPQGVFQSQAEQTRSFLKKFWLHQ